MILGINAFNLRAGGGVTHLVELLGAAELPAHGFDRVIVWAGAATLAKIDDRVWLQKVYVPILDRGIFFRVFWQRLMLKRLAAQAGCDVLFVPGGSDASGFGPIVTMSRNMLPFEWAEMRRYGWSLYTLKFLLLRWSQSRLFRKAEGVIFLTEYARDAVLNAIGSIHGMSSIIPHGISPRFYRSPRPQLPTQQYSAAQPCRVLYVSSVDMYKHQWHVAEAVTQLRSAGIPVVLELVGPPSEGMRRLNETLNRVDPKGSFITYRGAVPYSDLDELYAKADIGVFASSCENMPNILLEGMAAGLPMACSHRGPMPEILGNAGVYFDPENPSDIAHALRKLIESPDLREQLATAAFERAQAFSWRRCAEETFGFLAKVSNEHFREKT